MEVQAIAVHLTESFRQSIPRNNNGRFAYLAEELYTPRTTFPHDLTFPALTASCTENHAQEEIVSIHSVGNDTVVYYQSTALQNSV